MKFDKRILIAAIAVLCASLAFVPAANAGHNTHVTATATAEWNSSLLDAASVGDVAKVKALIASGADVNATKTVGGDRWAILKNSTLLSTETRAVTSGITALMLASESGHIDVVQALLAAKANVNAKDNWGHTALMAASQNGHLKIVRTLLAAKADVNAKSAIVYGSRSGNDSGSGAPEFRSVDVKASNYKDDTALMLASENGHFEIVQALIAAKADVNAKELYGNNATALMLASEQGHLEIVRALIAAGADVNAKTSRGETALMDASDNGNPEIVQALLAAKADLNAEDEMGRTAMMRVSGHEGHSHIVRLLFEASGEGKIVERMAVAAIVILGAYFALIRRRKRGRAR